ncbi:MAG TPA: hypothetical protein VJ046_03445 [Candidatus Paceibacterota bacterium]|nr:hypothetical protein [Candidatus Paceibacterota bacterium]
MSYQHKELASGRWNTFSFFSQMANIGSEVLRAVRWRSIDKNNSRLAAERALELVDLTIDDPKNHTSGRLKELWRLREFVADYFFFGNEYNSTPELWRHYFDAFAYAANR